jgi:cytochrome c biogenesis protein CcmG, thiol:disulfide interchange protein DsbE
MMHTGRRFLLIFLIGWWVAACSGGDAPGLAIGTPAPAFSTTLLNGRIQSLKALQGKVVLLNFWATWCGPCRVEMPYFQKLADTYKDQGFVVLAINNQESAEVMQPFIEEYKLTFPIGLDKDARINALYMARQYPTTYVIGRDGNIIARQFGPFPEGAVEAAIANWLK